jgi:hypothetical protein
MTIQYNGDPFYPSDFVQRTDQNTNKPEVNPDQFVDKTPVDAAFIHETPVGATVTDIGPLNEPVANTVPVGETAAVIDPVDVMLMHEAVIDETAADKAPGGETVFDESQVSKSTPYQAPMGETMPHAAPLPPAALLNREESERFRTRWNEIQGMFVDEPRAAVQHADGLVSEVIEQVIRMFANERGVLENQWKQGSDVSTEDLRKALQQYRSFFNRLVV